MEEQVGAAFVEFHVAQFVQAEQVVVGGGLGRDWELEDLIECWSLDEFALLADKTGRHGWGWFRTLTVGDEDKLIVWQADKACPVEISRNRLRSALVTRCSRSIWPARGR